MRQETDELIEEARIGYKKWKRHLELLEERYVEYKRIGVKGFKTDEEVKEKYERYVKRNSPESFLDNYDAGISKYFKGMDYIPMIPSKVNNNIYYDKRYDKLKANKKLSEFYTIVREIMTESMSKLPETVTGKLSSNYMAEVDKDLIDMSLNQGISKNSIALRNKIMKMNSTKETEETRTMDDGTEK